MIPPRWAWTMHGTDGVLLAEPLSPVFANQYDAEQWLGQTWRELAAVGVGSVVLFHEGRPAAPAVRLSTELS
jgi:hypothetical protein